MRGVLFSIYGFNFKYILHTNRLLYICFSKIEIQIPIKKPIIHSKNKSYSRVWDHLFRFEAPEQ